MSQTALLAVLTMLAASPPDFGVPAQGRSSDRISVRQARWVGGNPPTSSAIGPESEPASLPSRAVTTPRSTPATLQQDRRETADLETRLAVLEATRQDLSAWATILIGVVTLLLAANVGLSIWQVGSIARKEADAIIADYNVRFSGFMTSGQRTITETLTHYEGAISELSRRLDEMSARVDEYSGEDQGESAEL
jgi:hypothetical protein